MRLLRILFILNAVYLIFIGGTAYYNIIPEVGFFHHGFLTLILAIWLIQRLRSGHGLPTTPLNLPIYGVVIVWGLASLVSIAPRTAFENLWFPLVFVMLFFILADLFQRGHQKLVMETQFIVAALVVLLSVFELASWYFGLGFLEGTRIGWAQVNPIPLTWWRVSLAMNISTIVAGYVAPLVTITAAWALTVRKPAERRVLWGLALLLTLVLVLTFSRGGVLSLAIAGSVLAVFRIAQSSHFMGSLAIRMVAAVAVLGIVGVVIGFVVLTISQSRTSGDEGRLDMWRSAVLITRDYPVLGVGVGLYGRAFRDYRDATIARDKLGTAHNALLNTAAETGLVGVTIGLILIGTLIRAWYRQWRLASSPALKLRLEAALAALIGFGVHNLVDVFTITSISTVLVGLGAYCVIGHRSRTDPVPRGQQLPALIALAIIIAYGVWFFIQIDPAYAHYLNSSRGTRDLDGRLVEAQAAADLDPYLNLYDLQIAYLMGLQADTPDRVASAVAQYRAALALEPTWDAGWMNLAALELRQNNPSLALAALTEAQRINVLTVAPLNRAYVAETYGLLPRNTLISIYAIALTNEVAAKRLPIAPFWVATEVRRDALDQYLQIAPLEIQYRVLAVHDPIRAAELVPASPTDAQSWWILGQAQFTTGDLSSAATSFTRAIELAPTHGDYYAARARTTFDSNPMSAERDLNLAYLLGTLFEPRQQSPTNGATSTQESARIRAVPQEFGAVLYVGRLSGFNLLPELYPPNDH